MKGCDRPFDYMESVYFHFPFCETKCHYCDFYSLAASRTSESDKNTLVSALRSEVLHHKDLLGPKIKTIFLGGGTPSMTDPESMAPVFEALWLHTQPSPHLEWSMEANPSSVDRSRLEKYRALGVNRISMGVQALDDTLLKTLGRVHSQRDALGALGHIFSAGFDNVSVDLICGVPGQTLENLRDAMSTLTAFPITHLSCYLLTLPSHHRMAKILPNDETQLEHLLFIDQFMTEQGFEHYEISNFCRKGLKAQHNLAYWTHVPYLGIGPSAHSFDGQHRWKNISSIHRYSDALKQGKAPLDFKETLTDDQKEIEKWMLSFRLNDGFELDSLSPLQEKKAQIYQQQNLMEPHPTIPHRLRLTPRGFTLTDQLLQNWI